MNNLQQCQYELMTEYDPSIAERYRQLVSQPDYWAKTSYKLSKLSADIDIDIDIDTITDRDLDTDTILEIIRSSLGISVEKIKVKLKQKDHAIESSYLDNILENLCNTNKICWSPIYYRNKQTDRKAYFPMPVS